MPSDRTDFLREYYRLLADDIRRSELSLFIVAAIEVVITSFVLVIRFWNGPIYLAVLVGLVTTTWGMHALINANLWARRSHLMASNVEREFFMSQDIDILLPKSYYTDTKVFRYRRIFRATLFLSYAFFAIALISLPSATNSWAILIFVFAMLLLASVYAENRACAKQYAYLVTHAPGRSLE